MCLNQIIFMKDINFFFTNVFLFFLFLDYVYLLNAGNYAVNSLVAPAFSTVPREVNLNDLHICHDKKSHVLDYSNLGER